MSDVVIHAQGLGKRYRIGTRKGRYRYVSLREVLTQGALAPVRRVGRLFRGGRVDETRERHIWALRDLDLELRRGQALGIVGHNGAGKTTLLKLLSRITEPTTGKVELRGRVGSLLEVGTGFHPELTGRENIFLNGAILGMGRQEIANKFDEIVDFAETERFLDTPVKRYSSGMYVRLAFSVAAHLEPDILLVDEVLAVGDAAFQKKCLGRMSDVTSQGRTVLFVSHNLPAITRLCDTAIHVQGGRLVQQGESQQVVSDYLASVTEGGCDAEFEADPDRTMRLRRIRVLDAAGPPPTGRLEMGQPLHVEVEYDVNRSVEAAHVICFVHTADGTNVLGSGDADCQPDRLEVRPVGRYRGRFELPAFLLGEGHYTITVSLSVPFGEVFDRHANVVSFEVEDNTSVRRQWQHNRRPGILGLELPWEYDRYGS